MVSALLTAGSSTVLASVGRVSDEVAVRVMTEYHRQVTVNGAGPAQALAAASAPEPLSSFVCFGAG
jgi:CHAT domain-containing protein